MTNNPENAPRTACLVPMWDGPWRHQCGCGTKGVCAYHGPHKPHPDDGRPCAPNPRDGYCHTHGVYMPPDSPIRSGIQEES